MTTRATGRGRGERGLALVAVMLVLVLLLGIAGAFHGGVISETALRGSHARSTAGFYAAEAGINRGMGDYRNIFNNYNVPTVANGDFNAHTFTLGPRTVTYQLTDPGHNPTTRTIQPGKPFAFLNAIEYQYVANGTSSSHSGDIEASIGTEFDVDYVPMFQFLAFYQGDLEILPGPTMTLHGPIHTNGNLYFNENTACAGSPCVGGLTIAEQSPQIPTVHITAAGDIYRQRKDVTSTCSGTVSIAKLDDANHDGVLDQLAMPCSGQQSSAQLSSWLGSVKSHQPTVSLPPTDIIARGNGTFWTNANLRIVLDRSHPDNNGLYPIVAQNVDGTTNAVQNTALQAFMLALPGRLFYNDIPGATAQNTVHTDSCHAGDYCDPNSYAPVFSAASQVYACGGSSLGLFTGCAATVGNSLMVGGSFAGLLTSRRGGFYNNRELKYVYMLNLNLHDLLVWNRAQAVGSQLFPPDFTGNTGGVVIFLSVQGPAGEVNVPANYRNGVRVFGTPNFDFPPPGGGDPTGVTMASDQAFYVEGDYNTTADATHPKMPAAVIGDTINVLSRHWSSHTWANVGGCMPACWNDCQSRQALPCRPAGAALTTTAYTAFLGGVDVTPLNGGSTTYNGGFENYPRFHESWTGATLTYRGSYVSLGQPKHANGAWTGTGSPPGIYDPPVRQWDYDVDFQDVKWLPPLTPRVVSVQQIVFTENFR